MASTASPRLSGVSRRPVTSVFLTLAAIMLLMTLGGGAAGAAERLPVSLGHALSHLFVAAPLGWLLASMVHRWPPAREIAPGQLGRRTSVLGITGAVAGQMLEVVGARVDEPSATALEAAAHTAGMVVTNLSVLVLAVGAVLALVAAARDRAVPRWLAPIVAVLMLAALAAMVIGEPGT